MNKVLLSNMMFYGFHGVHEYEREVGQRFYIDVEYCVNAEQAALSDDLTHAVDYTVVYSHVKQVIENHRFQLLEALGRHIADSLLELPLIRAVTVRIRKPYVPIPGQIDYVQVETQRTKA
ncbi:hypothetical protein P22_2158 [Propionispora sp. 2/2-37]|uniref:dihydroneopterin aldolase n=1 Tax=Propionispora sp. 2/2-37 TaxID=1677858 RepID=UPI0006C42571|nr:dihydroneopterin aldolase [Propionispora sp. 2/2-37]CUH96070.1 hypothetical protein P22_2158 [Propionispora sp. 2/2-37]